MKALSAILLTLLIVAGCGSNYAVSERHEGGHVDVGMESGS